MVYHWQSHSVKLCGVDDMVLLPRLTEDAIVDNLKKRFLDDYIFTSIGPVLISVNPFKQMKYFGDKEIEQYQGAALYENPPHVFGLSDQMFRNLLIDAESQCVIISGESGAGKTVAARYIMSYIARISGGSDKVQHVKDIVLNSNPLLEAFGNAKTIRNNNSSRFGKYVEIIFNAAGQPVGGRISNFLLEKSRVPNLASGERNFHIFYQLCSGAHSYLKKDLGIVNVESFQYLKTGGSYSVEGINDTKDFAETLSALKVMGFSEVEQRDIWNIVAAILHLGNVNFRENGNYAQVADSSALDWPAYLLGIDKTLLESKLTSRLFESKWGTKDESVNVTLNVEQAIYTRDALAKGVYAKLFDYLVQRINAAMFTESRGNNIGILDIYGFEILDKNGFEQLCINFVNEKLQQIFIQLTLKAEQEEYVAENITWTPIDYFNNQVVCELLEGRQPPGVFLVLDDVCATLHAVADGADNDLQKKLNGTASSHKHFSPSADGFVVKHYAGVVSYSVDGFCDRNRDVFFPDLIQLLQSSSCQIIHGLFPEPPTRSRPTTAGNKIRSQAGELVAKLMQCAPHYVRCIKPNETKRPREWDELRVKHQVEYLGLRENISVRRAGFAYRRPFEKFLQRYAILTKESWPMWRGNVRTGVKHILSSAGFKEGNEFQLGLTKVFIKNPESLFHLEELREQQFDKHAKIIQRAFKKHFAQKQQCTQREEAAALFHGKKERRKLSINRHFVGDYLGVSSQQSELQTMIGRREKILFSIPVIKYDRRFKPSARDLVLTSRSLLLINSESQTGSNGNQPVIKRNIPFPNISHVTLSSFQDDFVLLHVNDDYDSLLEVPMKTEFIYVLHKRYVTQTGRHLRILFSNSVEFSVKKTGLGGGGKRNVVFVPTIANLSIPSLKVNGNTLTVGIGAGLPSDVTLPPLRTHSPQKAKKSHPRRAKPKTMNSVPTRPAPTRAAPPPPIQQPPTHSLSPTLPSDALNGSRRVMHSVKQENSPPAQQTGKLPNDLNRATNASPQIKPTRNLLLDNNQDATNCVINNNRPINVLKHELNEKVTVKSPVDFGQELTNTIKRMKAKEKVKPFENSNRTASETISTNSSVLPEKPIPGGKGLNGKVSEKSPVDFGQELTNTIRRMKAKERVKPVESSNRTGSDTISTTNSIVLPEKPIPGGGRPRPTLKPSLIKVKAVYDYQAQDADELSLKEGDFIDLIKEHPGGWWQGRLMGKEGLFPANYVLKV